MHFVKAFLVFEFLQLNCPMPESQELTMFLESCKCRRDELAKDGVIRNEFQYNHTHFQSLLSLLCSISSRLGGKQKAADSQ